jgi:hypothetical protein
MVDSIKDTLKLFLISKLRLHHMLYRTTVDTSIIGEPERIVV